MMVIHNQSAYYALLFVTFPTPPLSHCWTLTVVEHSRTRKFAPWSVASPVTSLGGCLAWHTDCHHCGGRGREARWIFAIEKKKYVVNRGKNVYKIKNGMETWWLGKDNKRRNLQMCWEANISRVLFYGRSYGKRVKAFIKSR